MTGLWAVRDFPVDHTVVVQVVLSASGNVWE